MVGVLPGIDTVNLRI